MQNLLEGSSGVDLSSRGVVLTAIPFQLDANTLHFDLSNAFG